MDIIIRILNFSIMILAPICLGVYLAQRYKSSWSLFGVGMITFMLSQVLHIPFNNWVLAPLTDKLGFFQPEGTLEILIFSFVFSLSAGVFEEPARYLVLKFWAKDARSWKDGLMFGAGHGGIEAILAGGLALYGFVQAITLKDADLSAVLPPEQIELAAAQLSTYWSIPWHTALLGAVERIAAITFHLSAALLVVRSINRKEIRWLVAAISLHTLLNFLAVASLYIWGIYVSITATSIMGLLSFVIILTLRERKPDNKDTDVLDKPQELVEIQQQEPTIDNLEDSRYA